MLRHPTGGVFAQENKGIAALRKVAGIRSNAEGVQGRVLVDMICVAGGRSSCTLLE